MKKRQNAFTLVEILVVLAIIAILAALLFPAFGRARESARQTTCIANLSQIQIAVQQYRKDEGRYPDTLVDILAEGARVADPGPSNDYKLGSRATGYLKGGQDILLCPNDDTLPPENGARSSYGSLSKNPSTPLANPLTLSMTDDFGKYTWNYWGTREDGFAYANPTEASTANGNGTNCSVATPCLNLVNPTVNYNQLSNPVKYSMSNRFAAPTTIITHCVYHRLQTANSVNVPGDLYVTNPQVNPANVRDIVLRLDGSARAVDVSKWKTATPTDNTWQKQTP